MTGTLSSQDAQRLRARPIVENEPFLRTVDQPNQRSSQSRQGPQAALGEDVDELDPEELDEPVELDELEEELAAVPVEELPFDEALEPASEVDFAASEPVELAEPALAVSEVLPLPRESLR
jgi:hypothetical protein